MKNAKRASCSECGGKVKSRPVTQEFERGGVCVEVSDMPALVCERCGEINFMPGGAQAVVEAATSLLALARGKRSD